LHDNVKDRSPQRFGGQVTIHTGGKNGSFLLVPVIPATR